MELEFQYGNCRNPGILFSESNITKSDNCYFQNMIHTAMFYVCGDFQPPNNASGDATDDLVLGCLIILGNLRFGIPVTLQLMMN